MTKYIDIKNSVDADKCHDIMGNLINTNIDLQWMLKQVSENPSEKWLDIATINIQLREIERSIKKFKFERYEDE